MSEEIFVITETHLKLLKRLNFQFIHDSYTGSVTVDSKRPYGESYIEGSIAEIIGLEGYDPLDGEISDEDIKMLTELHESMVTVLRIIASTFIVEAGTYVNRGNSWSNNWSQLVNK